jgi:hypothetical protein
MEGPFEVLDGRRVPHWAHHGRQHLVPPWGAGARQLRAVARAQAGLGYDPSPSGNILTWCVLASIAIIVWTYVLTLPQRDPAPKFQARLPSPAAQG